MSSFIQIELDTTPPIVEVLAPNETTTLTDTIYRVEANEKLSNIQDFYFKDSSGIRHDVVFQYFETYFEGLVSFDFFSEGIATFYAQVYDEVLNKSNIVQHQISIVETREDHEIKADIKSPREVVAKLVVRTKIENEIKPFLVQLTMNERNELELNRNLTPYVISTFIKLRNELEIDILNDN